MYLPRSMVTNAPGSVVLPSLCLSLLVLGLTARPGDAQFVRGMIADRASGGPVAYASVILIDSLEVVRARETADREGAFVLEVPAPGTYRVRVEGLGYEAMESEPLLLDISGTVDLPMLLGPQPIELGTLTVTAELRLNSNLEGFLFRQRSGFGRYLGPAEVAKLTPTRTSDLVNRLVAVEWVSGVMGGIRVRSLGRNCWPALYVDGFLVPEGAKYFDSQVMATSVRAMEVYRNWYQSPYSPPALGFDCAIIVVWTDLGFGR